MCSALTAPSPNRAPLPLDTQTHRHCKPRSNPHTAHGSKRQTKHAGIATRARPQPAGLVRGVTGSQAEAEEVPDRASPARTPDAPAFLSPFFLTMRARAAGP